MKRFFQSELQTLRTHLVLMGEKSLDVVRLAVQALIDEDQALAERVLKLDDDIDHLEMLIDAESIRYISLRAPVASDVRLLTVAMKTSHELERIGDEATSIAKRARKLLQGGPLDNLVHIPKMSELAVELLRDSLDSFIDEDSGKAFGVPRRDKEIDELNRENYQKLTDLVSQSPEHSQRIIDVIFISKSLERIGDHATNIAEEVIYLLRGEDVRHTPEVRRS